jgi:hypothetical protein
MADDLFYVYSDPGPVPEDDFNDWYDNEHAPARLTVPGFRSVQRYRALDGLTPPWLALYQIAPGTLDTPGYKSLADKGSEREKALMPRLKTLDRRVYEQISEDRPASRPAPAGPEEAAPVVMTVSMTVPAEAEDDVAAWYTDEHIPMLLAVPGWRRVRRFRLKSGTGPALLSMHEVDDEHAFETDGYKAAASTPWRERVLATAIGREKRTFGLHKAWI